MRLVKDPSCVPHSTRAALETGPWKRAGWGVRSQGRVIFSSGKLSPFGALVSSSLKEGLKSLLGISLVSPLCPVTVVPCYADTEGVSVTLLSATVDAHAHAHSHSCCRKLCSASLVWKWDYSSPSSDIPAPSAEACP